MDSTATIKERREEEEKAEEEEKVIIGMPIWPQQFDEALLSIKGPPMESIPEDEEESAAGGGVSHSNSSTLMVQSGQSASPAIEKSPPVDVHHGQSPIIIVETPSTNDEVGSHEEEEAETDGGGGIGRKMKETRQTLREVYTTEEIDTLISTMPKEAVPLEWENFSSEEVVVDPKMAHTYVTELVGGLPSARGSKYSYIYESRLEDEEEPTKMREAGRIVNGQNGTERENRERNGRIPEMENDERKEEEEEEEEEQKKLEEEMEERQVGEEIITGEDGIERHCTSTQKITRVTKITTTRSVKQIPVEPGDLYFDADGNPIINGFNSDILSSSTSPAARSSTQPPASSSSAADDEAAEFGINGASVDPNVGIDLSRTYISEHEEQYYSSIPTTSSKQVSPQSLAETEEQGRGGGGSHFAATPSAPGVPQVTELTDSTISLAWLRPNFDGNSGPLIGYRVEFRRSEYEDWDPAHDDLLGETECKITNLDPDDPYQFRVLGANMAGFGLPSAACPPIRLREQQKAQSTQFGTEVDFPPAPGRPQVIGIDSDRATIEWRPSMADPTVTTINGQIGNGHGGGGGGAARSPPKRPADQPAVIGYMVEYRAAGSPSWVGANDWPTKEHRFQVLGLRPNGEYEFRVLARDEFGRLSASPSSGFVRVRPPAPIRQVNGFAAVDMVAINGEDAAAIPPIVPEAPTKPKVLESGPNWVHLHWDPSPPPPDSTSTAAAAASFPSPSTSSSFPPQSPLAFLLEMRELGEQKWTQLADQHISPLHRAEGADGGMPPPKVPVTTTMDHFIVENLLPDSTGYEFRVWATSLLSGLRSARPSSISDPIRLRPPQSAAHQHSTNGTSGPQLEWSQLANAPPSSSSSSRKPPEKPSPPEYIDYEGSNFLTLCWLPARSVLPVQGYEVEFRDLMQDAKNWYRMTEGQLVRACKTSIGSLLKGHQYQFRVLAKNAVGLSQPSDPSPLIQIPHDDLVALAEPAAATSQQQQQQKLTTMMPLIDEMTMVRESPPLPDRDDSPPPIYRQTQSSLQWRDPTLKEVIDYLKSPDQSLVLDASGYLQHLTYNNDVIKEETRSFGGIECLISLLRSPNPEILRNVCGCLKNLAFGKGNDANKRLIHQKGGLKALAQLLRSIQQNALVHEEATGALWNISSADELKEAILNQTAEAVIQHAVLHYATQIVAAAPPSTARSGSASQQAGGGRNPAANVFRNGTGILRNISAVNDQARRFLRSAPGLVDILLNYLEAVIQRGQLDTRTSENVICLLRNLSYRVQEVVDPKYDPNRSRYQIHSAETMAENGANSPLTGRTTERSRSAPSGSPKVKKSSGGGRLFRRGKKGVEGTDSGRPNETLEMPAATGPQRLWHPSTVRLYIRALQDSADCEILEASAAAIQNLAGCPFDGSILVRQTVRTEMGLPILVELLRLKEDRVICAVCCALRNLALDPANLDLIGRFALHDLIIKIPDGQMLELFRQQPTLATTEGPSDATLGAILGILWEAVKQSPQLAKAVHETAEGTQRLRLLSKAYPVYGRRVCKYATQVLFMMWRHKELHEMFRRSGLAEADFYSGTLHLKGKHGKEQQQMTPGGGGDKHSPSSMATTLARPFSSQGMERPAHLALASSRMDNSAIDSSHYGAFNTPPQSVRVTPPSATGPYLPAGADKKPPQPKQHQQVHLKNGQRHYEPSPAVAPIDHLYASVQKGNGNGHNHHAAGEGNRRTSIDSWV